MTDQENQAVEGAEAPEVGGLAPVPEVQEEYEPTEEEAARMQGILDAPDEDAQARSDAETEATPDEPVPPLGWSVDDLAKVEPCTTSEGMPHGMTWCKLEKMVGQIWMRDRNALTPRSVHYLSVIRDVIKEGAKREKTEAML